MDDIVYIEAWKACGCSIHHVTATLSQLQAAAPLSLQEPLHSCHVHGTCTPEWLLLQGHVRISVRRSARRWWVAHLPGPEQLCWVSMMRSHMAPWSSQSCPSDGIWSQGGGHVEEPIPDLWLCHASSCTLPWGDAMETTAQGLKQELEVQHVKRLGQGQGTGRTLWAPFFSFAPFELCIMTLDKQTENPPGNHPKSLIHFRNTTIVHTHYPVRCTTNTTGLCSDCHIDPSVGYFGHFRKGCNFNVK